MIYDYSCDILSNMKEERGFIDAVCMLSKMFYM